MVIGCGRGTVSVLRPFVSDACRIASKAEWCNIVIPGAIS